MTSQIAILSAQGLGDALLMRIACYYFEKAGADVILYHPNPEIIQPLFPQSHFSKYPPIDEFTKIFAKYDLVFLENDHSEKAWALMKLREEGLLPHLEVFFPTLNKKMQKPCDYLCDPKLSIATNLSLACHHLLPSQKISKDNNLTLPTHICKNKHPTQVILHPTSKDPKRNWKKKQFLSLAKKLKALGFTPIFSVSVEELPLWESIQNDGFHIIASNSLLDLAILCYESTYFIGNDSGIGHLASNVGLPTITISGNPKRVSLWRPDWAQNFIVTLPFDLPNFKGINFRFRENYWQNFIPVSKVLKKFHKLIKASSQGITWH